MKTYVMEYEYLYQKLLIIDAEFLLLFTINSTMRILLANDNCDPY